jgi:phosphate transport system protein
VIFHAELQALEDDMSRLSDSVTDALLRSVRAATEADIALAEAVVAGDAGINAACAAIERRAVALLATQQPMAGDLRAILATLSAAVDLERAGDHAKGIATGLLRSGRQLPPDQVAPIQAMCDHAVAMLDSAVRSFRSRDLEAARAVGDLEAVVDGMFDDLRRDQLARMLAEPTSIPEYDYAEWSAKNLERAADHATNIAERVVFLCTGDVIELND